MYAEDAFDQFANPLNHPRNLVRSARFAAFELKGAALAIPRLAQGVYQLATHLPETAEGLVGLALAAYEDPERMYQVAGNALINADPDKVAEFTGETLFFAGAGAAAKTVEGSAFLSRIGRSGGVGELADTAVSVDRFSRYGGRAQRDALLKAIQNPRAVTLAERKGLVYGFRQMRRLGYALEDVDLSYRGRQGIDLVFSRAGRFAVLEAKHGQFLSELTTYSGGLRQGTMGYTTSRLGRYIRFGTTGNAGFARTLLAEEAAGRLGSFASFYRGRRLFELPAGWPRSATAIRR